MDLAAFFAIGRDPAQTLPETYNYWLVALSYAIAALASYTFLQFAGRIVELRGSPLRLGWLAAGAITMGGGVWAMHFVAMLAHVLPIPVSYDPLTTMLSVMPAILAAGVALHIVARPAVTTVQLLLGGTLMGAGIGTMHYTGMAAMRLEALVRYDPALFGMSIVAAVVLAVIALQVRFWVGRSGTQQLTATRHVAGSLILGFAVAAMHYTAMASTFCFASRDTAHDALGLERGAFAAIVTVIAALVLTMAIVAVMFERLRQSETSFRYLFEKNPNAMWVHDRETFQIIEANAAARAAYGYSAEEFRKLKIFALHPAEDQSRLKMHAARTDTDTDMRDRGVWRHVTRDGTLIDVAITAGSITFHRKPARLVLAKDVTEQRRAEARLAEAEATLRQSQKLEAIGQLTGGVAHDFNNVLAIMMVKLESLADELPPDSPYHMKIESALAAGARGADVVSRLMTFARRRALEPRETAIDALFGDLAGLLPSAISGRVSLVLDVSCDLPRCRLDRSGFETAILNLAVNARDAMPDGGKLHIAARSRVITVDDVEARPNLKAGRWVEIAVRDTGSGMSSEVQARIFEPFFTTKGEGKGTGLGLAMVYGFVYQSGGFLTLQSAIGQGTTFSMYLPAIEASGPVRASEGNIEGLLLPLPAVA